MTYSLSTTWREPASVEGLAYEEPRQTREAAMLQLMSLMANTMARHPDLNFELEFKHETHYIGEGEYIKHKLTVILIRKNGEREGTKEDESEGA